MQPKVALEDLEVLGLGSIHHVGNALRIEEVVGLKDGDVGAGGLEALVHGVAVATVGLVDAGKAGILAHKAVDDRLGAIRGAIIDADDLEIVIGLGHKRPKALVKVALDVADGYEHAHQRLL